VNLFAPWTDYFVAQAGAAGALTGLIFVALSFNFDHIISDETWLGRAATGLIILAQPILYALICLWPTQTTVPVGWTVAGLAALATIILSRIVLGRTSRTASRTTSELASRLVVTLAQSIAVIIGGLLAATGHPVGLYVLTAGAITGLTIGLITAWVLLVEVRRSKS
jgi:hypothetical protein